MSIALYMTDIIYTSQDGQSFYCSCLLKNYRNCHQKTPEFNELSSLNSALET